MTISRVTQVAVEPVLVTATVDRPSLALGLIAEGRCFSVNLWSRDDAWAFVSFSKPARRDGDGLDSRPVRRGTTGAPIFT
jgi:flavin reductase (DIM6/NTAB) family NADH-FMN oxidoreductase RutF